MRAKGRSKIATTAPVITVMAMLLASCNYSGYTAPRAASDPYYGYSYGHGQNYGYSYHYRNRYLYRRYH